MVFRPSPRFALAKGLEHLVDVLLGPAGPPQHLARHMFDVLHGHIILVGRRVVNMGKPAVIYHCAVFGYRVEGGEG